MGYLESLPELLNIDDSPIYTDGSDIGFPNYRHIQKQIIPGSGIFEGLNFLHGETTDGKYVKGTLWRTPLVEKMESDMKWFRSKGVHIPQFERLSVNIDKGEPYELIVSDFIPDLSTFAVFKKYHPEAIGEAVKGIIKFANVHIDYLELSIEQSLPVLSDVHLRQLHIDKYGKVYMLDLEPRYSKSSVAILLNESSSYRSLALEYINLQQIEFEEINKFVSRCTEIERKYRKTNS